MRSEAAQSEVNWHTARAENGDLASGLKPAQNIYGDDRRRWGVQSLKNIRVMKVKIISKQSPEQKDSLQRGKAEGKGQEVDAGHRWKKDK